MKIDFALPVGGAIQRADSSYDLVQVPQNVINISRLGRVPVLIYLGASFDETELDQPARLRLRVHGPDVQEVGSLDTTVTGHRHPNLPPGWTVSTHGAFELEINVTQFGPYTIEVKSDTNEILLHLLIRQTDAPA